MGPPIGERFRGAGHAVKVAARCIMLGTLPLARRSGDVGGLYYAMIFDYEL